MKNIKIYLPIFISCSFLLGTLAYGIRNWKSHEPIDHVQFWIVGQAISTFNPVNVYDKIEQTQVRKEFLWKSETEDRHSLLSKTIEKRKDFNLAGTPFLYSVFYIFSSGDYSIDYRNFRIFCLLSYFVSIIYLCRVLNFSWLTSLLFPILFSAFFWPFKVDIRFCNVNQLQVAAIGLFIYLQNNKKIGIRNFLSGLVLGCGLMFKPNIIYSIGLLAVSWFTEGHIRRLKVTTGGIITGVLIAYLLPVFLFGTQCTWANWLPRFQEIVFRNNYFNSSFLGMFFVIRSTWPFELLGAALFLIVALAFWKNRPGHRDEQEIRSTGSTEILSIGMGLAIYILSGPLVHEHYFVLAVPLTLWMLRPTPIKRGWRNFLTLRHFLAALSIIVIAPLFGIELARPWHPNLTSYMGVLLLFTWATRCVLLNNRVDT